MKFSSELKVHIFEVRTMGQDGHCQDCIDTTTLIEQVD